MSYREALRQTLGALQPTSPYKKEAFLEKVRKKVAHYKPRIEEKCKVDIGTVEVKDYNDWLIDHPRRDFNDQLILGTWQDYLRQVAKMVKETNQRKIEMLYNHKSSVIYVPFAFRNRLFDVDFDEREKELDQAVSHELAHAVWDRIKYEHNRSETFRFWNEGFATYCDTFYFVDLYPKDYRIEYRRYMEERAKIEELVRRKGKGVILEIPKNWRKYSKQLRKKL